MGIATWLLALALLTAEFGLCLALPLLIGRSS